MAEAVQPTPYIGQPLRRREDYKFLTGKGRYVDDINLPARFIWRSYARRMHMLGSPALNSLWRAQSPACA